ncbi:MAG: sensor histidine kinase [Lachnospiraceae bacterium]
MGFTILASVICVFVMVQVGRADHITVSQDNVVSEYEKIGTAVCREIEDPATPIGIKKEYTFTLDEKLYEDTCLAFYTVHQYVEVLLDGEMEYTLMPSGKNRISRTVGSNWNMIPIYREDAGKTVQVRITPAYESFRDREVEFLIGSDLAIYRDRLYKDLPQLILGIMAIFVGFVFICVAGYNQLRKHRGRGLVALGIFSVMLGVWRLTDTRFTPFLFPDHPVLLFYISVMMLMLGMVPLMEWIQEYYTEKSRRLFRMYSIATMIVCLIQFFLQLTGMADLRDMLVVTHLVIAAGILVAIGAAVYERIKSPKEARIRKGFRLVYICVAGVILDVLAFYIKGNSSGLTFTLCAFLLYIVTMGIASIYKYSEQELQLAEKDRQLAESDRELAEKERKLAEKDRQLAVTERQLAENERQLAENDRKLTERRISVMMSQIRSHFIFNVLTTISGYCKIDPKKADSALIRFSRYLRKNIRIIEEEGLIDFATELEQVEDYVALEQLRFEDKIVFEKEIGTSSFKIPPLTIQPIVENAIKHGLVEHDRSGVILLRTERKVGQPGEAGWSGIKEPSGEAGNNGTEGQSGEAGWIEITVSDNGVGFVPEEIGNPDSVGIRNVRYRLGHMVGGSLSIQSVPGEGTVVTIMIPEEK